MQHARTLDQHLFGLRNVGIRNAAIHRAYRGALLLIEEADALGAFVGDNIIDVFLDRGLVSAVEFPLRAAFINRGVRALRLASTAVDALFCYQRGHFPAPKPALIEMGRRAVVGERLDRTATISARRRSSKYFTSP